MYYYWVWNAVVILLLTNQAFSQSCPKQFTVNSGGKITFNEFDGDIKNASLEVKYDSKGLQPFFNLANSFMNTVQPDSISAELKGVKLDADDEESVKRIRKYETPIIVAVAFGMLFMLLMPIVGMCFCCCRCSGKCGGKKFQETKDAEKHTKCFIMSLILVVVTIFMLCGVLFMFVTNNRTHETAQELGDTYENVIDSAISIATSTIDTVKIISNDFLPCLIDTVKADISRNGIEKFIGTPIKDFVDDRVGGTLDTASNTAASVDNLKGLLDSVKSESDTLKNLGGNLQNAINDAKNDLDTAAAKCGSPSACEDKIKGFKDKISVSIDFSSLPNIDDSITKIEDVQNLNLKKLIEDAKKVITDIPELSYNKSKTAVNDIHKSLEDLKKTISDQVNSVIDDIDKEVTQQKPDLMKYKTDYMEPTSDYFKYENYRWYAYFGLSGLMAFIILLIGFGLVLGICGYDKKALPSNRSATSNCGGNCLMAAVGFMFIFSFFLMAFCVIWYAVGIHLYLGCRDLKNGEMIDNFMDDRIKIQGKTISVKEVLESCRNNQPLYQAIGGEAVFNITSEFDFRHYTKNIDKYLAEINFDLTDQKILTPEIKKALDDLASSDVDKIDYATFFSTLSESITNTALDKVSQELDALANGDGGIAKTELNKIAENLRNLDKTTVTYISGNMTKMKLTVTDTQTQSKTLTNGSRALLTQLEDADAFLQTGTSPEIAKVVRIFSDRIISYLVQSTEFLVNQALHSLLKCEPVSKLYDGLVNTLLCDDVVQNANGFWLALGWCLLFFVFAIIFSVKLAKYYRKMDYDAGLDRMDNPPFNDKIPLQTVEGSNGSPSVRRFAAESIASNLVFTDYMAVPQQDELLPDYEMHAPPPYQQHQNQGYHNQ